MHQAKHDVMTAINAQYSSLFFIYLRTELNYLSNDIFLWFCGCGLHVM